MKESESEIEDEVDILMSSDIVAVQMSTRFITFARAQSGFFFRADKTVTDSLLITFVRLYWSLYASRDRSGNGRPLCGGFLHGGGLVPRITQAARTPYAGGFEEEQGAHGYAHQRLGSESGRNEQHRRACSEVVLVPATQD